MQSICRVVGRDSYVWSDRDHRTIGVKLVIVVGKVGHTNELVYIQ